jgi:tellurite resistance protein TehA-like permease
MHRHKPDLHNITAALLLPIVATVVASATGGIVAESLPSVDRAMLTLIISYLLWGIGQFFSAIVLALYFHRLTLHSLPAKEAIVSVFLPIGPLGQGGFGIQQLGKVARVVVPKTTAFDSSIYSGDILYVTGTLLLYSCGVQVLSGCRLPSPVSLRSISFHSTWDGGDLHFLWVFWLPAQAC